MQAVKKKKKLLRRNFLRPLRGPLFPISLAAFDWEEWATPDVAAPSYVASVITSSHTTVCEAHIINRVQNCRN